TGAGDHVLPVGVHAGAIARELIGLHDRLVARVTNGGAGAGVLIYAARSPALEVGESLGVEDLNALANVLDAVAGVVADPGGAGGALIRRNQDHAVGAAGAIDRRGRGILEDLDGGNAVGV